MSPRLEGWTPGDKHALVARVNPKHYLPSTETRQLCERYGFRALVRLPKIRQVDPTEYKLEFRLQHGKGSTGARSCETFTLIIDKNIADLPNPASVDRFWLRHLARSNSILFGKDTPEVPGDGAEMWP